MLYYNAKYRGYDTNSNSGPKKNNEISLFSRVVSYMNSKLESGDAEFTTKDYLNKVGSYEVTSRWKRSNNNHHYRTYMYRTYLKRLGYLQSIGRGKWKVMYKIPEYVNSGFVNFVLGYSYTYDHSLHTFIRLPYVIKVPIAIKNLRNNASNTNELEIAIDRDDFRTEWERRKKMVEFQIKHGTKDLNNPLTSTIVYYIHKKMFDELRRELETINYK